jgi:ribosomal protein L15
MSYLSDFERKRIKASVYDHIVLETHYISDPVKGIRRKPQIKKWRVGKLIGSGAFGEVRLETCEDGTNRAVKKIKDVGGSFKMKKYEKELLALLEFSKPKVGYA